MSNDSVDLIERIATAVSSSKDVVEQTLNDYGLNLATSNRRHRSIRLDRLRIRGDKAGTVGPGAFDETFTFGLGVTVIAAGNLRGKTSILEVLTLVLRGEPRNLQADVFSWLNAVSLDVHINGQPIGFRLTLDRSEITRAQIFAGAAPDLAASDDSISTGITELACAESNEEWAEQVGAFMMNQLGLEEIQVFNKGRSESEPGTIKSHGWPSYFSVLYPPSGADRVLLGSTAGDFLPVRLMQVFLDMPEAARSMRVRALAQRLESEFKAEQRRGKDSTASLARQLQDARARLANAESRVEELDKLVPAENLQELTRLATEAAASLTAARQAADTTATAFREAQLARAADEKSLNMLRESRAASVLFHGLDPRFCPRCENPIGEERRTQEHDHHQCAVCDTTLQIEQSDDYEEREQQVVDALAATRKAEKVLDAARSKTQLAVESAQQELDAIDNRMLQAQAARQLTMRIGADHELAAAKAVVQALESMTAEELEPPTSLAVLNKASQLLRGDITEVSIGLYDDLSNATRELAHSFGIGELEGIRVKGNGNMDVTKGGGATSGFGAQSPGERLRLRYALVVALLRTARKRGIAGHPGLLLLDSLKAEEVQDDHAQTLLQGLVTAAQDEPGLQILVTTADQTLAASVSGVSATISPKQNRTTLF